MRPLLFFLLAFYSLSTVKEKENGLYMCSKCLTPISFLGQYHSRYNLCFRKYLLFLELTCPIHTSQSVSIQIWPFCIFRYLPFKIQLIVALCALWSTIITLQSVSPRYKLLKLSCSLNVLSWYQSRYDNIVFCRMYPLITLFSNSPIPLIYSVGINPDTTIFYSAECIT